MNRLPPLQSKLLQAAGTLASRRGPASLLVLIYHRVLPTRDPLLPDEPDAADFSAQMDLIGRNFRVLPLREAVQRLRSGDLPARSVSITFDDGYANNCEVALPILRERGIPATVFVATGFLNGGRMFNDTVIEAIRRAGAELDLLLIRGRRRLGIECKYTETPGSSKSMHVAMTDLKLDALWVVYPGEFEFPLGDRIEALPLKDAMQRLGSE
jgi:peptidoglycan/xylan/chitin deacetylase (PgdA/CDA1 family)